MFDSIMLYYIVLYYYYSRGRMRCSREVRGSIPEYLEGHYGYILIIPSTPFSFFPFFHFAIFTHSPIDLHT